ncbi:MAG: ABC transporter permease, partial [Candidatus Dojkabacteria bacterium]
MIKLIIATTKQLFRDKQAVFWSLVFPLIFVVLFGLFDFSGSVNANILIVNNSGSEISQTLVDILQEVDGVGINTEYDDLEDAKTALSDSQSAQFVYVEDGEEGTDGDEVEREESVNLVIHIPEGYGDYTKLQTEPETEFQLKIFFDASEEGQISPSGIVASIVSGVTDEIALQSAGATDPFTIEREGVSVNEITYYDTLVPGVIGMSIMQSGIIGMAAAIASLKEKRILKRLSATPLSIWRFLLAEVIAFLILSLLQVTVMLVVSTVLLKVNIYGSIPLIYLLAFIGNFVFLNLGFVIAALAKTAKASESLSQTFTMPMMFLSGVFFARETLPDVVRVFADLLPLSPLLDALRAVALRNASLLDLRTELLIIAGWTVVSFVIAAK